MRLKFIFALLFWIISLRWRSPKVILMSLTMAPDPSAAMSIRVTSDGSEENLFRWI